MTNIEAAFLYDQLNDIDTILQNKQHIFKNYETLLEPLIKDNKVKLFEKEENTQNSCWIFALRLFDNKKSIEEITDFFNKTGVDIRPFFYPINKHKHLSSIKNTDEVSIILNREIIMIPSSPNITIKEQQQVVNSIFKFILLNHNIKIVELDHNNANDLLILDNFINTINSSNFRYFDKKKSERIKNHLVTLLFYDILQEVYFGYTHIDYDSNSNKYWFGIYLDQQYRNRKLGNLFLNYTLLHDKIQNIDNIHLSVDSNNDIAIALYQKNGFTINKSTDAVIYMNRTII
jgi:GNAT superfamily N-acetyltransferase